MPFCTIDQQRWKKWRPPVWEGDQSEPPWGAETWRPPAADGSPEGGAVSSSLDRGPDVRFPQHVLDVPSFNTAGANSFHKP